MKLITRKDKKHYICFIAILFTIGTILLVSFSSYKSYSHDNSKIDKILSTSDYEYLPNSAKNYIKDVYDLSGEVILTEKNKQENVPYLNPEYVKYLELSEEEKASLDLVPEVYLVEYEEDESKIYGALPASFDLRTSLGGSYISPIKNQAASGLCWGFASFEQVESYLMLKNSAAYSSSSDVFSIRHVDYLTSYEGIKDYSNKLGSRKLYSDGGNFFLASQMMAEANTLISDSLIPWNTSGIQKSYSDIYNYNNSKYEVNSTISLPNLKANPSDSELTSYVNIVKNLIMTYGGAYVGTDSPGANCSSTGSNGSKIIRVDNSCTITSGHAMQIIGWDDNYTYTYCKTGTNHSNNTSSCSASNLVSKKGAYILRNSWGNNGSEYVYLAYDSQNSDINLSTDVTSLSSRTWDNNYYENPFENKIVLISTYDKVNYQKKINTSEKLEKIKFTTSGSNGSYNISITSGSKTYKNVKTVNTTYPGVYTVDLSSNNIILDNDNFTIEVVSTNSVYLTVNTIIAFTSNVSKTPLIETPDLKFNSAATGYQAMLISNTKNITSGTNIAYTLYDKNNSNVTSKYLTIENNKVGQNMINAKINLASSMPAGTYSLKTTYGSNTFSSSIVIDKYVNLSGEGTTTNPYLIHNEKEFNEINYDLDASYKLANSITLSSSFVPVGSENAPFTGTFDGGGYTIEGLNLTGNTYDYNGLFGYVKLNASTPVFIKNLIIKNPNINTTKDASALIGKVMGLGIAGNSSQTYTMNISNVYIMGGSILSSFGNAGSLIAQIESPYALNGINKIVIDSVFSSSTIFGDLSSGLIGYISGGSENAYAPLVNLTNIQTMGRIGTSDSVRMATHGAIIGRAHNYNKISIENALATNMFYGMYPPSGTYNILVASYAPASTTVSVKNSYGIYNTSTADANLKKYILDLKNPSLYTSWTGFSSKWKLETINGYTRIPILKGVPFVYSDVSDITIDVDDAVKVGDYLNIKDDLARFIITTTKSSDVFSIRTIFSSSSRAIYDHEITGRAKGTGIFNFINQYDGLEKNIKITVLDSNEETGGKLTLYANDDSDLTSVQNYNLNEKFNIRQNPFTREGYTFSSWNTKANGNGTRVLDGAELTLSEGTYSLYAIWTPINYVIGYNANGGSGSMASFNARYGYSYALTRNKFTKTGYTFSSWNTKPDGMGTTFLDGANVANLTTENNSYVTLYAIWAASSYTIVFDANGGSGTMSDMVVNYDNTTPLKLNAFTRSGKKFKCWNTKADGSGSSYSDGQAIRNLTTEGIIRLYAIWEDGPNYTIRTYSVNNSTMLIDDIPEKTTQGAYKANFVLSSGLTVNVELSSSGYVYTGSKTRIYLNGALKDTYTNVIRGDANGDGQISTLDYVAVKNHIMSKKIISNQYLMKGADANKDNNITSLDYVRIKNRIMKG